MQRTRLLIVLLIVAMLCTAISAARLQRTRDEASRAHQDLILCQGYLKELAAAGPTQATAGATAGTSASADPGEITRRMREAASAAQIDQQLTSIEPGPTNRIGESSSSEMQVFLHLEPVSLRQVVTFVHQLSATNPAAHAKTIELEAMQGSASPDGWSADVSMGYLVVPPPAGGR